MTALFLHVCCIVIIEYVFYCNYLRYDAWDDAATEPAAHLGPVHRALVILGPASAGEVSTVKREHCCWISGTSFL